MTPDPVVSGLPGGPDGTWAQRLASTQRGALIIDLQGRVLAVNAAACALLGRTEDQLRAGDWWLELDARTASGVSLAGHTSLGRRAVAGRVAIREQVVDVARADGMRMWLSVDYEPLIADDDTVGALSLSLRALSGCAATPTPSAAPGRAPAAKQPRASLDGDPASRRP